MVVSMLAPKNRSIPAPTVIPVLPYPDVRKAAEWLTTVFGFTERLQIADHRAQMNVPGGGAMIVAEYVDRDRRPQEGVDHVTHQILVRVADVRGHCEHVRSCGGEILMEPVDFEYGERQYVVRDPGGHRWLFSETLADVHPSEWGDENVILKAD